VRLKLWEMWADVREANLLISETRNVRNAKSRGELVPQIHLKERTKTFALEVVALVEELPRVAAPIHREISCFVRDLSLAQTTVQPATRDPSESSLPARHRGGGSR